MQLLATDESDCRSVLSTDVGYALQGVRDSQGCGRHREGGREAGPGLRHRGLRGAACERRPGRHSHLHRAGARPQQGAGSLMLYRGSVQRDLHTG